MLFPILPLCSPCLLRTLRYAFFPPRNPIVNYSLDILIIFCQTLPRRYLGPAVFPSRVSPKSKFNSSSGDLYVQETLPGPLLLVHLHLRRRPPLHLSSFRLQVRPLLLPPRQAPPASSCRASRRRCRRASQR